MAVNGGFDEVIDRQCSVELDDHSSNGQDGERPRKAWNTFTRLVSIALIISDVVFDWLQFYEISNPLADLLEVKDELEDTIKNKYFGNSTQCNNDNTYVDYYLYFTIAGTLLSICQIVNIVYQIYAELRHGKKIKKILDGRTEVVITYIFEEIPQIYLIAKLGKICDVACDLPSVSKGKQQRKVYTTISRGATLINQSWRSWTSSRKCEFERRSKSSMRKCCCRCCCPCFYACYKMCNAFLCCFGRELKCRKNNSCNTHCIERETRFLCCCFVFTWCPRANNKWCVFCCSEYFKNPDNPCFIIPSLSQLLNLYYAVLVIAGTMATWDCSSNVVFDFLLLLNVI